MMAGRRIGEAFVDVKADTSGTGAQVRRDLGKELDGAGRESGRKVGKSFGDEVLKAVTGSSGLNASLKALNLNEIDIKASPRDALAAIAETEVRLAALSGDAATVEIKVKTERARSELARFKKQLGAVGEDVGPKLAADLTAGAEEGATSAVAVIGPILGGAAIGAAPLLAGTISGAIIGGAGLGGVVGGVLLAVRDARIQAAGKQLGERLLGGLEQDAAPFVQPLLDGLDLIDARFLETQASIRSIFANASRFVRPLVDGLTRGVQAVLRGLDNAVAHAGPVISVISGGMVQLGLAVEAVFNRLAQNAPAAASALQAAFSIVDVTIRSIAVGIDILTRAYGIAAKFGLLGKNAQADIFAYEAAARSAGTATTGLGASFLAAAPAATAMNAAIAPIAPNLQDIAAATRAVHTANSDLFSSETNVATALQNASAAIGHNNAKLDVNSAKGRANREALSQVAAALQTNYDKYVQVNGVGTRSAAVADHLRAKFIGLAEKAGLSAAAAKNLADKILDIPSSHDTRITARNEQALEAAREVRRAINAIPNRTVYLTIRRTGDVHVSGPGGSGTQLRAAGGPVRRGMAYIVGERRPELFVPNSDGTILPSVPSSGAGVQVYITNSVIASKRQLQDMVVEAVIAARRERKL